jgi:hypothetical protein
MEANSSIVDIGIVDDINIADFNNAGWCGE